MEVESNYSDTTRRRMMDAPTALCTFIQVSKQIAINLFARIIIQIITEESKDYLSSHRRAFVFNLHPWDSLRKRGNSKFVAGFWMNLKIHRSRNDQKTPAQTNCSLPGVSTSRIQKKKRKKKKKKEEDCNGSRNQRQFIRCDEDKRIDRTKEFLRINIVIVRSRFFRATQIFLCLANASACPSLARLCPLETPALRKPWERERERVEGGTRSKRTRAADTTNGSVNA